MFPLQLNSLDFLFVCLLQGRWQFLIQYLILCTTWLQSIYHTNCTFSHQLLFYSNLCYSHRKVTVPYPVAVPGPSVSYSPPVVVGHGLYDHSYGHRPSYGSGIYSSYGPSYSSGIKVISSPSYGNSYRYGGYGGFGGYGGNYGHSSLYHGGYSGGYHGGIGGSYHGGIGSSYHGGIGSSYHGAGLGFSLGTKYGWPLKFGLKYHHYKK